jgi:hypothetical protein
MPQAKNAPEKLAVKRRAQPLADTSAFGPLALPTPNAIRGHAPILQENHAPDALDQNLFAPGSNHYASPPPRQSAS